jgi:hypothetical protein
MRSHGFRRFSGVCLAAALGLLVAGGPAEAQSNRGFDLTLAPDATGEELTSQSDFWALEVTFKPMRMIWVDVTDPKTGRRKRELFWYLCYKAVNRPQTQQRDESDTTPLNDEDPPPSPPLFVPEFILMTEEKTGNKIYRDVVVPEAHAAILKREKRTARDPRFKNSVEVVGPIPAPASPGSEEEEAIFGVAMWRGIDLRTDNFTVFMNGFSNGYKVANGPNGEQLVLRRTIVQDFWRPGDEPKPDEREIRREGDPRWVYRPDDPKSPVGEAVSPVGDDEAADEPAENDLEEDDTEL